MATSHYVIGAIILALAGFLCGSSHCLAVWMMEPEDEMVLWADNEPEEAPFDVQVERTCSQSAVTLHVYYLGNVGVLEDISLVLQDLLGGGGLFHVGVEVHGKEWSFGSASEGCGIYCSAPRHSKAHRYRESIYVGNCSMTEAEVHAILERLSPDWEGSSYCLLDHNCVTFSETFCHELGVHDCPKYLH